MLVEHLTGQPADLAHGDEDGDDGADHHAPADVDRRHPDGRGVGGHPVERPGAPSVPPCRDPLVSPMEAGEVCRAQ